jgi:DNA mismatch repair ATPase MutS
LTKPVKNSIAAERGILLTGSNASGKSTFLKTVAVNAILSQSVNTCPAKSYRACFFDIYSSMALRDNLGGGESYYIVEIKSLKRILDGAGKNGRPVLCFVDEVLRGTNTVERIAASTQILKSLGGEEFLCFAATHDIELTDLLSEMFDNYHFEEEVRDKDVVFPYQLLPGKAVTRNAIRLLEMMGYPGEIISAADSQARHFISSGKWESA